LRGECWRASQQRQGSVLCDGVCGGGDFRVSGWTPGVVPGLVLCYALLQDLCVSLTLKLLTLTCGRSFSNARSAWSREGQSSMAKHLRLRRIEKPSSIGRLLCQRQVFQ
jgi:hypothetical protein